MSDLTAQVQELFLKNCRQKGEFQYTVPSPDSYPYQWLWDSCFHAIILSHFNLEGAKKELLSLTSKQFSDGMIPHMIYWEKASKTDFPVIEWGKNDTSTITQPPMLALAVWQIYKTDKDLKFVEDIYPSLVRFYKYFLTERDSRSKHLVSIINPDESGEDNSSRFDIGLGLPITQTQDQNFKKRVELIEKNHKECNFEARNCMKNFFWIKDVPINAILVENLKILSEIALLLRKDSDSDYFFHHAQQIKNAMRKWMMEDGVLWSIYLPDYRDPQSNYQKIEVKSWAMFAPLFAKIYTQKEAEGLIYDYLENESEFKTPYLLPTVSTSDPSFDPNGFWRGPVWMATNWFIYKGLQKYGFDRQAEEIKKSSIELLEKSGFREQFNPITGEGYGAHNFTWGGLVLDMTSKN